MIKLGRMRIENFKSFIEPIEFDFSDKDLVLFDGPNGFGKTTIFDAVELCFIGKISRIKGTDNKTKEEHILKGDNTKPTTIQLELLNDTETPLIIGVYIPENILGKDAKVDNYTEVIKRFETEIWLDDFSHGFERAPLDLNEFKKLLDNEKLDSTFTLFNYIQQEDTCHFLKEKEGKRHDKISHLFGTGKEKNDLNKLDALDKNLGEEIKDSQKTINEKKGELTTLSNPVTEIDGKSNDLGSQKISLLSDLASSTVEQLESYQNNLEGIRWILNNKPDFSNLKFNHLLETKTQKAQQIENIIKFGSAKSYDEVSKLHRQYTNWKKTKAKAESYNTLIDEFASQPNTLSKEILNTFECLFDKQYEKFTSEIGSFDSLKLGSDSCDAILNTIEESRKNLLSHYERHTDEAKKHEEVPCPFCGDTKSEWQDLLDEYDEQTTRFKEQLGENGKALESVTEKLIEELVTPLIKKMGRFITRYEKYINYDFKNLKETKSIDETDFDKMNQLKNWLALSIEDYSSYQDDSLYDVSSDYNGMREKLITFISSHKKSVSVVAPKTYSEFMQDLKGLGLAFDDNDRLPIDTSDIDKDLLLLSRLIVQMNSAAYRAKKEEIDKLEIEVKKLEIKKGEIKKIRDIYNNKIKTYEKGVAKHIAIPLFVYSSKILQSRIEGSGVFLITPDNSNLNGFMQFSAAPNDSHDAWNTMSSGQLAGVVISFMLAMNKVYPSNLSTLMIDDPVQTMDEVNMASFVQMMRYEFPEKQVLLSTHENKVANYFHYKYEEAGLKSLPINMKNKKLN